MYCPGLGEIRRNGVGDRPSLSIGPITGWQIILILPPAHDFWTIGSIKCVTQALITTSTGRMDADPEIRRLKPDIYV